MEDSRANARNGSDVADAMGSAVTAAMTCLRVTGK